MKQEITFEDYTKLEIKVGTVLSVKKNEKARKPSLVVEVDFGGSTGIKKSSAQITHYYNEHNLKDVAASYQEAIVDCLAGKLEKSMDDLNIDTGIVCGGVAANQRLREKLGDINKKIIFPSLRYCTDNADMIAFLAEKKINNNSAKIGINFSAYSRGMVL